MTPKNQPANYETFNHNNHHLPPSLDFTSFSSVHDNYKFFTSQTPTTTFPLSCNTNRLMLYWVTLKPPKGIQMKHILILISILLLSSPLFGQSKKSGLLYIWGNGSRYVGEWKDGKKHGQGTYTSGKGTKGKGKFKDNTPWNISLYGKYGNFTGKYVNGVKQ